MCKDMCLVPSDFIAQGVDILLREQRTWQPAIVTHILEHGVEREFVRCQLRYECTDALIEKSFSSYQYAHHYYSEEQCICNNLWWRFTSPFAFISNHITDIMYKRLCDCTDEENVMIYDNKNKLSDMTLWRSGEHFMPILATDFVIPGHVDIVIDSKTFAVHRVLERGTKSAKHFVVCEQSLGNPVTLWSNEFNESWKFSSKYTPMVEHVLDTIFSRLYCCA